jgi:hypothetical protein
MYFFQIFNLNTYKKYCDNKFSFFFLIENYLELYFELFLIDIYRKYIEYSSSQLIVQKSQNILKIKW